MSLATPFPPRGEFTYDYGDSLKSEVSSNPNRAIHDAAVTSRDLEFMKEMLLISHAISVATVEEDSKKMYVVRGSFATGARLGIEAFFRSDLPADTARDVLVGLGSRQGSMLNDLPFHQQFLDKETPSDFTRTLLAGYGLHEERNHPETIKLKETIVKSVTKMTTLPAAPEYTALGFGYTTFLLDIGVGNVQNPPQIEVDFTDWDELAFQWFKEAQK